MLLVCFWLAFGLLLVTVKGIDVGGGRVRLHYEGEQWGYGRKSGPAKTEIRFHEGSKPGLELTDSVKSGEDFFLNCNSDTAESINSTCGTVAFP